MSSDDDIAGTSATNKSPKHAGGVHIQEVIGACKFKGGQNDLMTYVVEVNVIEHTPRDGALLQEAGTTLGWVQVGDKPRKPAIKAFTVAGAKALAIARGVDPNAVKETDVTGDVVKAMFPEGNENKGKSILRGLRFVTDSTPKESDKGPWTLVLWQPYKEQPSWAAAQASAAAAS